MACVRFWFAREISTEKEVIKSMNRTNRKFASRVGLSLVPMPPMSHPNQPILVMHVAVPGATAGALACQVMTRVDPGLMRHLALTGARGQRR